MARLMALVAAAIAVEPTAMGSAAAQQAYPERTVRFILPYGAASASDTTARLFADRLSAKWGKPVVVENRPGGDGIVSMQAFVAANDDHTLWFGPAGAFTVLPYQHDTLPIRSVSRPQPDRERFRSSCWRSRCPHRCMSTRSLSWWRWRASEPGSSTPRRPAAFRISCCSAFSRIWDWRSRTCRTAISCRRRATSRRAAFRCCRRRWLCRNPWPMPAA